MSICFDPFQTLEPQNHRTLNLKTLRTPKFIHRIQDAQTLECSNLQNLISSKRST
ncbi:hypothetical protein JHK82_040070 [Glycine max]|nr:hypothetical protein JHK82_040070 [Glycine max]